MSTSRKTATKETWAERLFIRLYEKGLVNFSKVDARYSEENKKQLLQDNKKRFVKVVSELTDYQCHGTICNCPKCEHDCSCLCDELDCDCCLGSYNNDCTDDPSEWE